MADANRQLTKAASWMIGTIASFAVMAVAGREVSFALDTFEIMMYRSLLGLGVVGAVLTISGNWTQVRRDSLGTHAIRNLAHFTGQNLWFFAMTMIPLAQVFALEFTSPLWVIALSPLLLGESLTQTKVIAGFLGFMGVLIVARPSADAINPGVLAAAGSAVFFAVTAILTKRLTQREHIGSILFWLTSMQLIFGFAASGWDGDIALPDTTTAPWLALIALCGLSAHYCLTRALTLAPASVVVPIDFARLPVIAVVGMMFYAEPLDTWTFLGATVICLGNYINIKGERRLPPVSY